MDVLMIDGSYWPDYQIPLSKIQSIDYRESFSRGSRTNGLGSFKLVEGHFNNSEYGAYLLYAYLKCDYHIVLNTHQGILVSNGETEEKTKELYQTLKSCLPPGSSFLF